MLKSKVIYESEINEHVKVIYPCFELRNIVEYFFEIKTESNLITPFSIIALPNINIVASVNLTDKSQTLKVDRKLGIKDTTCDKLLNRYFKEVLGMSPKQCCRALRFKMALLNYRSKGSSNLYDELGYTDFSHFAKESQCLTNKKPSEL